MRALHPDIERVIFTQDQIAEIIACMGAEITRDYAGKEPVLIGVLKGASVIMADLMRAIDLDVSIDFMAVSSYGAKTTSSGVVQILKDLTESIENRDVIIVEDLLDSGNTLAYLVELLKDRNPASLEIATFFEKKVATRSKKIEPRYVGARVPDEFLVGYGFDFNEKYRNLPYVGVLKPTCYKEEE